MFVVNMFFDFEPSRIYGPFDTEDAASDWLDTQTEFGAAVIHEVRAPQGAQETGDQCPPPPQTDFHKECA